MFATADITENTRRQSEVYFLFCPKCTVAVAAEAIFMYSSGICECGSSLPILKELYTFTRGEPTLTSEGGSNENLNHLTPNDPYRGRTAPLISKRCILYIYSTNIGTEYFKLDIQV